MKRSTLVAIIDDDEHILKANTRLLAQHGFEVCTFGSAESFLCSPELATARCILCDLRLPGMSGVELLATLRFRRVQTPLIFITAHPNDIPRSPDYVGAVCVLKKPFDADGLMDCIERALRQGNG